MSRPGPEPNSDGTVAPESLEAPTSWYARVGTDWWATIVAGAITLLAVTNLLPKIGW